MATILVTGGAGFIGAFVCEQLLARGDHVVAFDNLDSFYSPAAKRANLATCMARPMFELVEGDIRDGAALNAAFSTRPDAVIHLAARAGVRASIEQPRLYADVNVTGTTQVLDACVRQAVRRVVFASSSSVYGNAERTPTCEGDCADEPISPYAATKRCGELICHTFARLHDLSITCVRLFTAFGPRQRPDLAIHKFAALIEAGLPIPVYGDGRTRRDYTFVGDLANGIIRAADRAIGYQTINLGGGNPVTLAELIAAIEHAMGKTATIDRRPLQAGDVEQTHADNTLARTVLDWRPCTGLADGLAEFVTWFRGRTR